jgi:hypothetical protein
MAFAHPPILSPVAARAEELARLVYELLDAHSDTERLIGNHSNELQWRLHLRYLQDLQRIGREVLAQHSPEQMPNDVATRLARAT